MRALAAAMVLAFSACPKERSDVVVDESDPLIQKLKAVKAKGGPSHSPVEPPPNPLAEALENQRPPEEFKVDTNASATAGGTVFHLKGLTALQSVERAGMKVTSAETFVRVAMSAESDVDATVLPVEMTLTQGTDTWAIAKDIQKIAKGSPLELPLDPKKAEEVVVYFEAPRHALKPGLSINLVTRAGRATLPLQ